MKMTGAKILIECLLGQGVDTVFGYPGGTILNVYDALYDYRDRIRHIRTVHEQGAAHAADGYARSTGKVGVCFATSGPGATNLVTGIATAYMDSSPVVFTTCNVGRNLIGKDAFQEVDITGISMPITKWNYMVSRADEIADAVREAFAIARSGRPGPVLIDILKNATAEEAEYHQAWKDYVFSFPTETEYPSTEDCLSPKQISEAVRRLAPPDTMIATDVGQHQMWAIQHLHYDYPGQLLTSGGYGAMGFGLGAAIGAKIGNPDKTVLHITGDGSFRMNCHELETVAVLVDNAAGVLSQVSRLFSRKGFNIESLAVGVTEDESVSRMTIEIAVEGAEQAELICNQLRKLIAVHSVKVLSPTRSLRRELAMIKVRAETSEARNELIRLSNIFRASIVDVAPTSLTIAVIGEDDKTDAIKSLVEPHGILKMARTGVIALERGAFTLDEETKEKGEFDYGKNAR